MQLSMPEVRSLPAKVIPTGPAYQPLRSAPREGVPPVVTGGVWSTWISSCTVLVTPPSRALQNSLVPGVSALYVLSWQPVMVASDGSTVQSIETFDRCQPEQSSGAGVHSKVTLGTASARGAASRTIRVTSPSAASSRSQPPGQSNAHRTEVRGIPLVSVRRPIRHLPRLQRLFPPTVALRLGWVNAPSECGAINSVKVRKVDSHGPSRALTTSVHGAAPNLLAAPHAVDAVHARPVAPPTAVDPVAPAVHGVKAVVARASAQAVASGAASQSIPARSPDQQVISGVPEEPVVARTAAFASSPSRRSSPAAPDRRSDPTPPKRQSSFVLAVEDIVPLQAEEVVAKGACRQCGRRPPCRACRSRRRPCPACPSRRVQAGRRLVGDGPDVGSGGGGGGAPPRSTVSQSDATRSVPSARTVSLPVPQVTMSLLSPRTSMRSSPAPPLRLSTP